MSKINAASVIRLKDPKQSLPFDETAIPFRNMTNRPSHEVISHVLFPILLGHLFLNILRALIECLKAQTLVRQS